MVGGVVVAVLLVGERWAVILDEDLEVFFVRGDVGEHVFQHGFRVFAALDVAFVFHAEGFFVVGGQGVWWYLGFFR